jgi:hypothetical protein
LSVLGAALFGWSVALGPSLLASSPGCPGAESVEARVREILGLHDNAAFEERATLEREGHSLRVTVRAPDERVLGDRLLSADGSCDDLTGAVAVVLAAWLSDFHPEFVASLPEGATPEPAPLPPARPPRDTVDTGEKSASRAAPPRQWAVSAALGADVSMASAAPFASLGVRFQPQPVGLGAAVTASFITRRSLDLSTGSVRYFRWPISLGPTWRVPIASTTLDFHMGMALGWLHVEGVGFATSAAHDTLRAGGLASTRLSLGRGQWLPFAELSGVWFGKAEAFVERGPEEPSAELPRLELLAAFGAAFRP